MLKGKGWEREGRGKKGRNQSVSFSPDLYMPIMWLGRRQVEKSGEGSMDLWIHYAGMNDLIPIFSVDVLCLEGRLEGGEEKMEIPGRLKRTEYDCILVKLHVSFDGWACLQNVITLNTFM